ncbi:MAG: glycosyltransferase [Thermoleophilia bacterium]|nr:glycosyltransferase [Thermoleophilia bacterium]
MVPVLNGEGFIRRNLEVVARELEAAGLAYEIVVVSDGSVDDTIREASAANAENVRVVHYDRNLGKGHAVRTGLVATKGSIVGFIDADLELHPAALPRFVAAVRERRLDAAIGSKRHPESSVSYPTHRRVYSWLYQQLVRVLFRLDVRDTQVGIKMFRRELVDAVAPHLLVKRYAFDLELLAVARDFGFTRIEEEPVRLEFSGELSGLRFVPIAQALWDTMAVFYRVRILRYYRRRRALVRPGDGAEAPRTVLVAVVDDRPAAPGALERTLAAVERLEQQPTRVVADVPEGNGAVGAPLGERRARLLAGAGEDAVAFFRPGSLPVTTWLGRLIPLLSSAGVVAAGGPVVCAQDGTLRTAVSSSIYESLFALGRSSRLHVPGNLRVGEMQDLANLLIRREAAVASGGFGAATQRDEDAVRSLARGGLVVGAPDAVVVRELPPVVAPLLRHAARAAAEGWGTSLARDGRSDAGGALRAPLATAALVLMVARSPRARRAGVAGYACALAGASGLAALKHRSPAVGLAFAGAVPLVHAARLAGAAAAFTGRVLRRRREPAMAARTRLAYAPPTASPRE